ncbi:glycoside hydrolase family 3 protein [Patellaria atrata CBS 101060]|uniref:beta-glucosidase n=1 Tax=Patellaria atrata CBS 101060 TaxID=1346257 RepID=A0A9P4S5E5_9PEZI|nr:glycoside hydrolase family 3 protein [Patellaria atrata CBS 101060]
MQDFDVEDVLGKLTDSERISLLAGRDFWHTTPIPRLHVPSIRVTDGPNGARGTRFFNGVPAACLPCGTALGATWDTSLLETAGSLLGRETRAKGAHVLLGPTINIQRSPLGGRGFESFSEDPVLSGLCAASVVKGVEGEGVVACVKHFVCNDQEHERMSVSSVVSERALRECYLLPFMICQREVGMGAVMTAYNKVNGRHVSEEKRLVDGVLRREWGFEGLVMSDWFGTYSTSGAVLAGMDLEMPGPTKWRGNLLTSAVNGKKVSKYDVEDRARKVLELVKRVSATSITENAEEKAIDTQETAKILRDVAAASIVLLKNEKRVLPFKKDKKIAIIGPNAKVATFCGGGSAALIPYYAVTPFDGVKAKTDKYSYALGATAYMNLPQVGPLLKTKEGKPGFTITFYSDSPDIKDRKPVDSLDLKNSSMFLADFRHKNLDPINGYYADVEGILAPEESGMYDFGLTAAGKAKLWINDELVVDNWTKQTPAETFFCTGTIEERGSMELKAGESYRFYVQWGSVAVANYRPISDIDLTGGGLIVGGTKRTDPEKEIEKAVQLAKECDQVVIFAGLNSEFETEGADRPHMDLPGHVDEMISAVAAANPNTAVVIQSGTPVTMPWVDEVNALVQAWYGGNETGNAIADILFGDVNPSGKLPLSFPKRVQDNPAFFNFRSEAGRVLYGEDVYVGYKYYQKVLRPVLFPFGHGLSYTTFKLNDLRVQNSQRVIVTVNVNNVGSVDGAEVVQVYIQPIEPSIQRPVRELKGFKKVFVVSGKAATATVSVDAKYAFSYWDESRDKWISEKGEYDILIGTSSMGNFLTKRITVQETSWWSGL